METTSLYIHVPFCLKKCPYCDFFSVPGTASAIDGYTDLLINHLQLLARQAEKRTRLESIFFGGGTPSLLPAGDIDRLLQQIEQLFGLTSDVEISLEANPGTVSEESLAGFRAAGINRLSLGIQSLCDRNLHRLGRQHDVGAAESAIHNARKAGFSNLSCDLMFALPEQSPAALRQDLGKILAFEPEHLAVYGLTVEEETPFHLRQEQGELELPAEEDYVAEYLLLDQIMTGSGYRHYEISNFARPGFECRHNQRYWQRQSNLGLGAGAHSFRAVGWGERRAVPDDLARYADNLAAGRDPAVRIESFAQAGAMAETLYLGLRTAEGVDADKFHAQFGMTVEAAYPDAIEKCGDMLSCDERFWQLNLDGWLLFDTLLIPFLELP